MIATPPYKVQTDGVGLLRGRGAKGVRGYPNEQGAA